MFGRNPTPHAWRKHALGGLALWTFFSALGCDAIVNTKGRNIACTTDIQCTTRFGEPSTCVDSACVQLLSPECTEVWPPDALTQDNTILIGYMGQTTGDQYGGPPRDGMKLALKEIETSYDGFPGVGSDSARRHLAMLVCDEGADPDRVARHLVQDAKVQAIVGASFSGTTLKVFNDVARPGNVLMLSPSATSPAITTLDDKGLLWRTAPSDVVQVEMLKYLKARVEDQLHDSGALPAGTPATVVMPTKDDSAGRGLANGARDTNPTLQGGAPPITEPLTSFLYDPDQEKVTASQWQQYSQQTIKANPDIIMAMGTNEFVTELLPLIEAQWDTNRSRPWYVFPEGDRGPDLVNFAKDNPGLGLNQRVIGAAPGARRSGLYKEFRQHFIDAFAEEPGNLAEFGYDAGYLVLYAIAIAKKDAPTGPDLATALQSVSCKGGLVVPAGKGDAFSDAANAGCIDFDGASGPLDFDPDTGEALSDIASWCLRKTKGDGFSVEPTLDTYYSVESKSIAVAEDGSALNLADTDHWCAPVK